MAAGARGLPPGPSPRVDRVPACFRSLAQPTTPGPPLQALHSSAIPDGAITPPSPTAFPFGPSTRSVLAVAACPIAHPPHAC
jgi:hypothetical protein